MYLLVLLSINVVNEINPSCGYGTHQLPSYGTIPLLIWAKLGVAYLTKYFV